MWIMRISAALYNVDQEDLKADATNLLNEKEKHTLRQQHRNPVINRMQMGQRDEQMIKKYYEILRGADKFMKTASPEKIEMVADKHGMNLGKKDKWGRRPDEHFGFYDPKNKNYGKSLAEVMKDELDERTSKDEDYPILFMFDNRPIKAGLAVTDEIVETKDGYEAVNEFKKALNKKFPMRIVRDDKDIANKIERLTDFLHVKKIDQDTHRVLEFFIDKKYKVFENLENSDIFDEIINFRQVWIKDEYDGIYGFKIQNYYKYLDYDEVFDVLKFNATTIENIKI
jgi:hypothetical protein